MRGRTSDKRPLSSRVRGTLWLIVLITVFLLAVPGMVSAANLPTSITANTTLTALQSPYTGTSVTIKPGVALTAEPGTVIKITGSFKVEGELDLNGTSSNPVVITSPKDDTAGGDSNKDGAATSSKPGDWGKVGFTSTGRGVLEYADVRYGGSGTDNTMIMVTCPCEHQVAINHSRITHSKSLGITLTRSEANVFDSEVADNGSAGIFVSGGAPSVSGNMVRENIAEGIVFSAPQNVTSGVHVNENLVEGNGKDGILVTASTASARIGAASLGHNTVIGNGEKGIDYDAYSNPFENSSFMAHPVPPNIDTNDLSENGENGIWLKGELQESATWQRNDYPIVVSKATFAIGAAATLTLQPGLIFKAEGEGAVQVRGYLVTEGTAEQPVTFTSVRDDSVGGDTNGDGMATSPQPGDWREIQFPKIGGGYLDHADIRYGGAPPSSGLDYTMIRIDCPCADQVTIVNSTITQSQYTGVRVNRAEATILKSDISDNGGSGIGVTGGATEVSENTLSGNGEDGIYVSVPQSATSTTTVDIDGNLIDDNGKNGLSVNAPTASSVIASAGIGDNTIIGSGEKAIDYNAYSNPSEVPGYQANPVPPDIDTNVLEENGENGIWLSGELKQSTTWQANDYAIVVPKGSLAVGPGATLTMQAGSVVKAEGEGTFQVRGWFVSGGNGEDPVTFTSLRDDTEIGDTNGDGPLTSPAPEDWMGIEFPDASEVEVSHLKLKYADTAVVVGLLDSMVVLDSDFIENRYAISVAETVDNAPGLAGLPCVPPYLSVATFVRSWFSPFALPAPNVDLSNVIGTAIPSPYAWFFGPSMSVAAAVQPNYGSDVNMIPFAIFSCPAASIPPLPVTPVRLLEPRLLPNY